MSESKAVSVNVTKERVVVLVKLRIALCGHTGMAHDRVHTVRNVNLHFSSGQGALVNSQEMCIRDSRYRYQKLTDPHDAYKVFEVDGRLKIELELCGLDPGIYRQESWTLNRSAGSTFDKWLEMEAPRVMTPEDLNYLNDMAQPLCKIRDTDTAGALHLQTELEPVSYTHLDVYKRQIF